MLIVAQILIFILTVALMELASYAMHRWLFHGPFWFMHKSHHTPREGSFESNDLFPIFFASISIFLFADGLGAEWRWAGWPIAIGMTTYGFLYFLAHDVFSHRRFFYLPLNWSYLIKVRTAHRRHHQDSTKPGAEPFGLFWY